MSYIDLIIIILIILGAVRGFQKGFTRELVDTIGLIVCLILAFILKNPLSLLMYEHLPFFSFGGLIKGVIVLNILLYEVLAFLIVFTILKVLLSILRLVTKIFEKLLKATIILGIPSKILGAVVGIIKWLIISYIILFVLALPIFNNNYIDDSLIVPKLLRHTPILSNLTSKTLKVVDEFKDLKDKYGNVDTNTFNLEALDLFLKYDIIDINSVNRLEEKGKFKLVKNIDTVLDKYRMEK